MVSITIIVYLKFVCIKDLKKLTATIYTPQWTLGRARGLLLVWRRELEQKLQIDQYLPGCSRRATLEIMMERMLDKRTGD